MHPPRNRANGNHNVHNICCLEIFVKSKIPVLQSFLANLERVIGEKIELLKKMELLQKRIFGQTESLISNNRESVPFDWDSQ